MKKTRGYLVQYTEKTTRHGETIEKRAADKTKLANSEGSKQTESGPDSDDERPIVQTLNKGQPKFGLLSIGTEVMRQFESGLFIGTVKSYNKKKIYTR